MSLSQTQTRLLDARVVHRRLQPRVHAFQYGLFYRAENIDQASARLRSQDHGWRDGAPLRTWADSMLARAGLHSLVQDILLLAMPRVCGYVFNPVSFWLCLGVAGELRAVLCEVNNTFGDTHTYICHRQDRQAIEPGDLLRGEKLFHVSPFMDRQGYYQFGFALDDRGMRARIDYFDADDNLLLHTGLSGSWRPDTAWQRLRLHGRYPLVTLRAIGLIHYHALRLALKRIGYRPRPEPLNPKRSLAAERVNSPTRLKRGSLR